MERDILPVQYGKLLINLQSPVNASRSSVPTTLSRRRFRMAWRALVLEALDVFNACGIKPKRPYVPFLPFVLALPDWAYNAAAFALFPLDPGCKSSMLQDCETGRATEIDALCGEIVRLARRNANRARDEDAGAGGEGGDDARGIGRGIGRALAALGFGFGGFGFGFGFGRGSGRRGRTAPLNARAIELVRRLERVGLPDGRMGPTSCGGADAMTLIGLQVQLAVAVAGQYSLTTSSRVRVHPGPPLLRLRRLRTLLQQRKRGRKRRSLPQQPDPRHDLHRRKVDGVPSQPSVVASLYLFLTNGSTKCASSLLYIRSHTLTEDSTYLGVAYSAASHTKSCLVFRRRR